MTHSDEAGRTTYAEAVLEYDESHERALASAIITAIAEVSRVSDVNAIVIRTGEASQALLSVLASVLAMSPSASRSPSAIRETIDDLGKRLRRKVAAGEQNADMQEFIRRTFRGNDVGGNA